MSGNSFGPAKVDAIQDMRDFDRLPADVRRVVREAPVNFKAGTILAVWRGFELDGGTVKAFVPKLRRRMHDAMRKAGLSPACKRGDSKGGKE